MRKNSLLFIVFIFFSQVLFSQEKKKEKYWVYFADPDTNSCVELRKRAISFSHVLNAGVYLTSTEERKEISSYSCVKYMDIVRQYKPLARQATNNKTYSFALEQVNADELTNIGLNGNKVKIGIIDGGFLNADKEPSLKPIFDAGKVADYKDYITPTLKAYGGNKHADDKHGTEVFKLVAGKTNDIHFGMATSATFFLARTDHGSYERRIEEDFVVQAMERFDSLGVHIINISLGYTNGFDDPNENYIPVMVDGKTSALTRAVDIMVKERDILIVVAAGNDGDKDWKIISTPADAQHALTVGATGYKYWSKASFSSIGPETLGYLKPEVSCFSNAGTSFSAPIITGIAACIKQYDISMPATKIKEIIIKASHLYPYGNNYLGYGVPDCKKIVSYIKGINIDNILTPESSTGIKHNTDDGSLVIFNKRDSIHVISQEVYYRKKIKVKLEKNSPVKSITTVIDNKTVTEIKKR